MRIISFFLLLALLSCTDIPDSDLQLQPTEMKVRVIDENYKEVKGADVYIFRDRISFKTRTGYVDHQVTDDNGFALFTDLEPYNYFIYATHKKSEAMYDNSENYFILYDYLTENALTSITVKTDLRYDTEPETFELKSIDFIPMKENQDWKGAYDTLWADVLLIEDYDWIFEWSEQNIVARDEYLTIEGKPDYGKIQRSSYPYNQDTYDNLEIDLASLDLGNGDPDTHKYTLLIKYFTNKKDYDKRELIYTYDEYSTSEVIENEFSLESLIDDAAHQELPYPASIETNTDYLKYEYKILLNVSWK